jgi:lipoprotein-anchoring transpeptidase ErfK/SrfK
MMASHSPEGVMSIKSYTYGLLIAAVALSGGVAVAQPLSIYDPQIRSAPAEPAYDQAIGDEDGALDPRFQRQVVGYATVEAPGTVIVDTANTYLYYVLGNGQAIRYGIGVGRDGFTWAGVEKVARKAEWPDWYPPAEMIERQPYLPRMTAGGLGNPLGARAMYLGNSEYRIHGTNDPTTIGKSVSSGCIRLTNDDVEDLYERVQLGAKVVILPSAARPAVAQTQPKLMPLSYASAPRGKAQTAWASIAPDGRD